MDADRARRIAKRILAGIGVLLLFLLISPVKYQITRALTALGALSLLGGALFLWWRHTRIRIPLLALLCAAAALPALPGRPVSPSDLRADYLTALRLYENVRYVWGGENIFGIDCSGLVRKGLVWGQILNGVRTLNGTPIRNGVSLWWHDCSARALLGGYRGLTRPLFQADSVNEVDSNRLQPGDLAVTATGAHVMVYVGDGTWTEADPDLERVVNVTPPTENRWFKVPVVIMRWTVFEDAIWEKVTKKTGAFFPDNRGFHSCGQGGVCVSGNKNQKMI